jgi:hypothetical protein
VISPAGSQIESRRGRSGSRRTDNGASSELGIVAQSLAAAEDRDSSVLFPTTTGTSRIPCAAVGVAAHGWRCSAAAFEGARLAARAIEHGLGRLYHAEIDE